jgi:hypothetical protein
VGPGPKNSGLILDMFLIVSFLPISDMGKGLKEHEDDFVIVRKIVDGEITL